MVEHSMQDVAERAARIYAPQIDAAGKEVAPLPKEYPIRYITKETLSIDAQWLDSVEKESQEQDYTGPDESLREQVQFCLDHINGAVFPEDDSIFYGVKGSKGDLGGYILTYALDDDHFESAQNAGLLENIQEGTIYREVSPFLSKKSDISQDQMINAFRSTITTEKERFSSAGDPVSMAFIVFEPSADGSLYEALGFKNMGTVVNEEEMPIGMKEQTQTVWMLAEGV